MNLFLSPFLSLLLSPFIGRLRRRRLPLLLLLCVSPIGNAAPTDCGRSTNKGCVATSSFAAAQPTATPRANSTIRSRVGTPIVPSPKPGGTSFQPRTITTAAIEVYATPVPAFRPVTLTTTALEVVGATEPAFRPIQITTQAIEVQAPQGFTPRTVTTQRIEVIGR